LISESSTIVTTDMKGCVLYASGRTGLVGMIEISSFYTGNKHMIKKCHSIFFYFCVFCYKYSKFKAYSKLL